MEDLKERQLDLLEETANHYNSTNRCGENGTCRYSPLSLGLEGRSEGCAIGRKLPPELALLIDRLVDPQNGIILVDTDSGINVKQIQDLIPPELGELGFDFLYELQRLHDVDAHWDQNGLTKEGKFRYQEIILKFEL